MASINTILNKVKRFERGWINRLSQTLNENKNVVLQLNKEQLLSGIGSDGNPLSPTYNQDDFFKTQEGRDRYLEQKKGKEANPKYNSLYRKVYNLYGTRDVQTPNLIVTGKYHKSLKVTVKKKSFLVKGTWSKAKNIENKYPNATGLTQRSFNFIWERFIVDDLRNYWENL